MKFFAQASRVFLAVSALAAATFLSSCTVAENGQIIFGPVPAEKPEPKEPSAQSKYYSSVHYIWVDEKNLDTLTQSNSRVEVDLGDQRARVYRSGKGADKLIIETQISTGKEGHNTPSGSYHFLEKNIDKHSNLYGKWVDADTGDTVISDGDARNPPSSGNAVFRGAPMPYWCRITPGGVGMHIGYVPNYPASHGCIRVPKQVQPLIFSKVRVGTPVTIIH
ncbi:MAG: L,D-transpeptidase family protein [Verrucomicrobiae bacterium]|nr:L,D-transpeptidase family protein [Verrucomicrobiae bacterium]